MVDAQSYDRIRALPIWQGTISVSPLTGGLTNRNFLVADAAGRFVVRLGADIPEHQVMRFNELAASRAAHAAGLSPAVVHAQKGITVIEYIEGRTLTPKDIRAPEMLARVVAIVRRCHRDMPRHLRGPALIFWVFHVLRDYAATLNEGDSPHRAMLPDLLKTAETLERAAGPFDIVYGHNDLLAANLLDDGDRLWLIDWDYAGFNTPLFDLGGLASNNEFDAAQEARLLELYFDTPPDEALWRRYRAMKCASLLRETMWSMVSEITSELDQDFAAYTAENLARFRTALADFQNS